MKKVVLFTMLGIASAGCALNVEEGSEPGEFVAAAQEPLAASVGKTFEQVIRHSEESGKQTNICRLSLVDPPAGVDITFTALRSNDEVATRTVHWQGAAIPPEFDFDGERGRTEVSGCATEPCRVTATMTTKGNPASTSLGCIIEVKQGNATLALGQSHGNAVQPNAGELPADGFSIFRQKLLQNAAGTRLAHQCTVRQTEATEGQVSGFQATVNSAPTPLVFVPSNAAIGGSGQPWPTTFNPPGSTLNAGRLLAGGDADSVRVKHVVGRDGTLGLSDDLQCQGTMLVADGPMYFTAYPMSQGMSLH